MRRMEHTSVHLCIACRHRQSCPKMFALVGRGQQVFVVARGPCHLEVVTRRTKMALDRKVMPYKCGDRNIPVFNTASGRCQSCPHVHAGESWPAGRCRCPGALVILGWWPAAQKAASSSIRKDERQHIVNEENCHLRLQICVLRSCLLESGSKSLGGHLEVCDKSGLHGC